MLVLEALFWLFAGLVVYTYAGYPAALLLVSRLRRREVKKGNYEPRISVILSAFNEEKHIEEKLKNLLSLDYPPEKVEILVGSDGASDRTDQIVSRFNDPRIRFFRFVQNLGKPHVVNGLVKEATGSLLVFTDSRQRFDKACLRRLAENFCDPEVGCASGELYFEESKGSGVARGMDAYWKYEKFLRKKESEIGSMLGATGAIYAIQRRLFKPMPHDILVDDMYVPLAIIQKGYRAVFDSSARAFDQVSEKAGQEVKRKIRTLAGNYQIFALFPDLLIPFRSPVAWQFISHKFLRLMVPFLLIALFFLNLALLGSAFFRVLFFLQLGFYGLAAFEHLTGRIFKGRKGIGYIPYMFCVLNYSAFMALFRYLKKEDRKAAWEKAYV